MRLPVSAIGLAAVLLALAAVLLGFGYFASTISADYLPVWSDEYFYYLNAQSAYENHSLRAALTFGGRGAALFGADAHGFAYPLLYALVASAIGWHNTNFQLVNGLLLGAAGLLIARSPRLDAPRKLSYATLVLAYPVGVLYAFTYMPEILHATVAVAAALGLHRLYAEPAPPRRVAGWVALLLVAGLFRPLWLFWLVGLLPLASTRRQWLAYGAVAGAGAALALGIQQVLNEPVPNFFDGVLATLRAGAYQEGAAMLLTHFLDNCAAYFLQPPGLLYSFLRFGLIGLLGLVLYRAIGTRQRLYGAAALVGLVNLLLLLTCYDVLDWREIRMLAPVFYFLALFLVLERRHVWGVAGAIVTAGFFGLALPGARENIKDRNALSYAEVQARQAAGRRQLAHVAPGANLLLLAFAPADYSYDLLQLPVRTARGTPLRYLAPYYAVPRQRPDYVLGKAATPSGVAIRPHD